MQQGLEGKTLCNRYFLRKKVGGGGMAETYLAWDQFRTAAIAVKILRRDLANSPRFFQLFANEAELLRKLEHPHIVRLYEFDKEGDIVFIVMDFIEGTDLRQMILNRKGPLSLADVSRMLMSVTSALNYAHQNKVYHCDIKPHNILIDKDHRYYLSDFGVARFAGERMGGGTPPYMAPELFFHGDVDARTDIYSLGMTLYEMLSGGKLPFRGDSPLSQGTTPRDRIGWEHMYLRPPPLRGYNMQVPPAVEDVIFTALSKDPASRYENTLKFREAFEHARSVSKGTEGYPESAVSTFMGGAPIKVKSPSPNTIPRPANLPDSAKKAASEKKFPDQKPSTRKKKEVQAPAQPSLQGPVRVSPISPGVEVQAGKPTPQVKGPYLLGRSGEWAGQIIQISRQGLTLGRNVDCQLHFMEPSVSRQHASIVRKWRGIYIQDDDSSIGTFINNTRIAAGEMVLLKPGDIIQIGYLQILEYQEG